MTPRSFFLVLVKVIAIFLLADMLSVLAQLAGWLGFALSSFQQQENLVSILITALTVLLFGIFIHYLLFSTDKVVDKLGLDKHFQEESFGLNIHHSSIIKVACIVMGGLFFMDAVPSLIKYGISYKRSSELGDGPEDYSTFTWIIFYIIKLIIGYLLFTNSSRVAAIIEKKRRS
jgi:hypothetical protein